MYHVPFHLRSRAPIYIGFDKPRPANGLGIFGLFVSMAALPLTLGLLSPLGLAISTLAVFRRPRGAAAAGVVFGLIGTLFWLLVVLGVVAGVSAQRRAAEVEQYQAQVAETESALIAGMDTVELYRHEHDGRWPRGIEGNKMVLGLQDAWQTPLRYDIGAGSIAIRSAGPDGKFETGDDLRHGKTVPKRFTDDLLLPH